MLCACTIHIFLCFFLLIVLNCTCKVLYNIYTKPTAELIVKDTTDSPILASYLDLYLEHDINGTTKLYDKRDDFNFPIVNYPFL